jgi:hypothetical protein
VTITNTSSNMCLQGNTLAAPDAASDCRWQLTRLASGVVGADSANGCAVTVLQQSGDFSE